MKNILSRRFDAGAVAVTAAIAALLGAIFGALMMLLNFDSGIDYFKPNALTVIFIIFCVGVILWLVLAARVTRTDKLTFDPCAERRAEGVLSIISAVVALAIGVILFVVYFKERGTVTLLGAVFAVLAAFYYLSLFTKERRLTPSKNILALSGFATVLWYILLVVYMYLDVFVTMNSPVKTLLIFALVAAMLATLSDVRYVIGRGLPRYSLAVNGINLFLGCTAFVSTLACHIVSPISDVHYLLAALASLSAAAVSGVRLYSVAHGAQDPDEPTSIDTEEKGS